MSDCDGEVRPNQNAFEQAGWMAYICSGASLSKNCRVIHKNFAESPHLKEGSRLVTCAKSAELPNSIEWMFKYAVVTQAKAQSIFWSRRLNISQFTQWDNG